MARFGLVGKKLGHSDSPAIHALLGDADYALFELADEDEVKDFFKNAAFKGVNVTIPYKETAFALCDEVSPLAARLRNVNTVLRREDGTLYGDNTDAFGFRFLAERSGAAIAGKKALILGAGGAAKTVAAVLADLGAASVTMASRGGPVSLKDLSSQRDAAILVNATPVGMYPNNGATLVDPADFPGLEAVFDLICNPARTSLMLAAEERNVPAFGGLTMLAAQAVRASELFHGEPPGTRSGRIGEIVTTLRRRNRNLILIGMPGCGKTAVGRELAAATGRPFRDSDAELERRTGRAVGELLAEGEEAFRDRESAVLASLGKERGLVIATGGGAVLREENLASLSQNGLLIRVTRPLERLSTAGRPLSQSGDLAAIARYREPLYRRFADVTVANDGDVAETVAKILEVIE